MESNFEKLDLIVDKLKVRKFKRFIKASEKEIRKFTREEVVQEDDSICDGYNFIQYYNKENYNFSFRIIFYIDLKNPNFSKIIKKSGFCVEYTTFINEAIFHPISQDVWNRERYFEDISILESLSCGRRIITYDNINISYNNNDAKSLYLLSHCIKNPPLLLNNLSFLVEKSFFSGVSKNFLTKLINILKNFGATVYSIRAQLYDNNDVIVLTNLSKNQCDSEVKILYNVKIVHINAIYDSIWFERFVNLDSYLL
uniref:BRCT domain-containing protein n=1 Tax=Strongyloides stercoralis TaxID=6248 RepID=A0A0K0EKK9_STRER